MAATSAHKNGMNGHDSDPEVEAEIALAKEKFDNMHTSEEFNENPKNLGRVIKKAKRTRTISGNGKSPRKEETSGTGLTVRVRQNSSGADSAGSLSPSSGGVQRIPLILSKNSKKSRQGRGRGLPKKGGAGGKGTWGAPGDEMFTAEEDEKDPNYDSDSTTGIVLKKIEPMPLSPRLPREEFKTTVHELLLEYYLNADTVDTVASLKELNGEPHWGLFSHIAVSTALDHKSSERELTSRLLSDMYGPSLPQAIIAEGFEKLLQDLPELTIDSPEAPEVVGKFIARAIADDCLPPVFVSQFKGKATSTNASAALEKAHVLLNMKHGIVRLDSIWGVGGGLRPVKALVKKMVLLLKEYLSSEDIQEATRCLKDLEVPHFHHELVYRAVVMAVELSDERTSQRVARLLCSLVKAVIVTTDQLKQGFQRLFNELPDIKLDVPNAYSVVERFVSIAADLNFIPQRLLDDMPVEGRKRFVSEGDGGLIKETNGHGNGDGNRSS